MKKGFCMLQETNYILHRRFDRMGRLVGDPGMQKIMNSHVMVIGVGGVGSWAAESLARSGVGRMTLVDFDEICITNTNRQLHALTGLLGQKKAQVLTERLRKINPQARFEALPLFYNEENCTQIFAERPDYVLDCIDNLTAKSHLISFCRQQGIPLIVSTGAAARLDPSMIQVADLAKSHTDPMAQQLRKILRTKHEFPRDEDFGVPCVFSDEEPMLPIELHYDHGQGFKCVCPQGQNDLHSCDKRNRIYGTASFVTGSFGFHMASWVIRQILQKTAE
jgi:tRNA A37 threonylcarbamoyladenosine dehydratase